MKNIMIFSLKNIMIYDTIIDIHIIDIFVLNLLMCI